MERQTNLRVLRFRHRLSLAELAACSGLSLQYISRAELGEISVTANLEAKMMTALEAVVVRRRAALQTLETDCERYKGRLFSKEDDLNE